ncbi:MAG TPA: DUF1614 domain-containing protein [Firmicutes bacterium]|nr:DUF1614 domain-containing protein [Bacillota bacterium]
MPLLLLILLLLPAVLFLFYFNIAAISFTKLGLTPAGAVLLFGLSLIGSVINIPAYRQRFIVEERPMFWFPFIFYYPPRVREQVIAINFGGAIVPFLFALYLLGRAPLGPALAATALVAVVAKALARPVAGVGIALPAFIPPLVAASAAFLLARDNAAPVAYIAGSMGTLIGADLLNLHRIRRLGAQVVSIGGAGVYDGIFLVGVVAALLA